MANLLLVNPAWIRSGQNIWKTIAGVTPPLGLANLAAYAEREGHTVEIIDCSALDLDNQQLLERIREKSYTHIGLTATTTIIKQGIATAKALRRAFPQATILFGGVHATVRPDEVLAHTEIDYVVRGEGELTLSELLAGREPEKITGLSFRDGERVISTPNREPMQEIDSLPRPAYHLLPIGKYYPAKGSYKRLPALGMVVSRGCPSQCTFCYGHMLGRKVRFRSAQTIFNEVRYLMAEYGIREISFYDDNFTVNKGVATGFCELLLANKVDLTWSCFSRVEFVNPDMLALLARAGCHQIMYGIESGAENVLRHIKKNLNLDRARQVIRETQKAGIETRATFMLGNPSETVETMQKTIQYALSAKPDIALFNITTPFPGTELFQWAAENKFLLSYDWEDFDLSRPLMQLPTVSPELVKQYYRTAYRKFYLQPRVIWRRIKQLSSWEELVASFRTFLGLLGLMSGK